MSSKQKSILIVEDDSIMGMEMQELIESLDYSVLDVVTNGEKVVSSVDYYKPDLILMDVRLKGKITGIDAAQEVRKNNNVPILFITGYKDDITVNKIHAIQNTFLVTKPINFEQFENYLKTILV